MSIQQQINSYLSSQPEAKRKEMEELHKRILQLSGKRKLWFLDGKNAEGKIVSNPNIGYGAYTIKYASGETKEFFQVGMSANTSGISIYIMGLKDKNYLSDNFGKKLGKAKVTGYCISFKSLKDISLDTLESAIEFGLKPRD